MTDAACADCESPAVPYGEACPVCGTLQSVQPAAEPSAELPEPGTPPPFAVPTADTVECPTCLAPSPAGAPACVYCGGSLPMPGPMPGARSRPRLRLPGGGVAAVPALGLLLGRDPASPVAAALAPFTGVSCRHAELRQSDGGLEVRDLGSTNGTWVDDRRIPADEWTPLGDRPLRLGERCHLSTDTDEETHA